MHHPHQQTHVAQQSIRKKLRVLSAPAASPQSDDSAGSATAFEVRQLELDAQRANHPDQFELSSISLRRYNGPSQHTNVNNIVPLQKGDIMTSDQYHFPTGSELFVAPATKVNSYVSASSGDLPSLSPPLVGAFFSGQGQVLSSGAFSNQTSALPKTACWNSFHAQLGQYNTNPPTIIANSPQGVPANTSSSSLQYSGDGALFVGTNSHTGTYGNNNKDLLMASFFPGANAQAEAMQLYLMNSGYNAYADGSTAANMVLLGPSTGITIQESHLYNDGQSHQPFIGIPGPPSALSPTSLSPRSSLTSIADPTITHPGLSTSCFPTTRTNNASNGWKNGSELLFTPSGEAAIHMKLLCNPRTSSLNSDHLSMQEISDSGIKQAGLIYTPSDSHGPLHIGSSNRCEIENTNAGAATYGQSLNLSLSSQRPSATQLQNFELQLQPDIHRTGTIPQLDARDSNTSVAAGSFNFLSSNKYLKAAQQLLNEVCNVGRERRKNPCKSETSHFWAGPNVSDMLSTSRESSALHDHSPTKDGVQLGQAVPSTSVNDCREPVKSLSIEERQECELKKAKLVNMLQEVDKRYRQYNDQMQVLISSFDSIVGVGAATPYTALALQAMSRYFRCLRDAISGQIQVVCKALGEEGIGKHITRTGNMSRLRYVDQNLRQQRTFQQLGMLQQHAWRPQRGLPERSVSILRAWLFEHFLHPYPKDADKMMLARQAGLTRSQVSNWFINARVRLWKPMVEEMYQEEAKDLEVEADVRLTDEVHDSINFEEGNAEASARRKHCKVESNLDQNYTNFALVEGSLHSEGASEHQNFLEGNVLASSFLPTDILSMRKQVRGTMGDISDAHLLEDGQKQRLGLVQNKKSRVNSLEPDILLANMPMEVDMKYDDTSSNAIDETNQKLSMASRNEAEHYNFSLNGSIHANVACFGAFDQRNNSSYGVGAGFDSRCPGNNVSLTLGLRHCDNLSGTQPTYFHGTQNVTVGSRENADSNNNEYSNFYEASGKLNSDHTNDPRGSSYHSRKHIESHMLHDFVIS